MTLLLFHFSMKTMKARIIATDRTPRFAASHLGLFCLPTKHKKGARFIKVKLLFIGSLTIQKHVLVPLPENHFVKKLTK